MTIKQMTRISLFTSLIIVLTIVVPPIPVPLININITLQTLVVMLTGLFLSPIEALFSMLLYLIIGAIGFPVFSGQTGGLGVLFSPKGGFLLSFPISAFLISLFSSKKQNVYYIILINMLFGVIFVYLIGYIWLSAYLSINLLDILFSVLLFIPGDLIKVLLATIIKVKIKEV